MKPYLECLPPENDDSKLKPAFLELFLDEVEKHRFEIISWVQIPEF